MTDALFLADLDSPQIGDTFTLYFRRENGLLLDA